MKAEMGTIVEGFQFLPSISTSWLTDCEDMTRKYWLQFSWLFWYYNISLNE